MTPTENQLIRHKESGRVYQVLAIGKLRRSAGNWVKAARYALVTDLTQEFYRALSDFDSFEPYEPSSSPNTLL